jgi:heme-degrading monooxygenase HmoA
VIVRVWRGQTTLQDADAYLRHVTEKVLPSLRGIGGYLGGRVLRREVAGQVEFLVLTQWASWDAIRAFAGENPDAAVVEPAAKAVLTEFDAVVRHFDVAHDS